MVRDLLRREFPSIDLGDAYIEWKSVPALDAIRQVVGRTSNRLFIGLPLCMFSLTLSFLIFSSSS